jgi:glyoxylase-like metal-dependent hydrolase (beta-lactamase superfamily II)
VWEVFEVKLYALHCGGEEVDLCEFDPFDPRRGTKAISPFFAYLIDHPQGLVLFDTGANISFATDPRVRYGALADGFTIRMGAEDHVVQQMGAVGFRAEEVDYVVLSHLHYDHAGNIGDFPQARIVVQRSELVFAHWPPVYQRATYLQKDLSIEADWLEVEGEYDVFGDGRLVTFTTPGHTAGHQSMLVQLGTRALILVGDAAYQPDKMAERKLPALVWNSDAMVSSWERLEAWQRKYGADLILTHDLGFEERTKVAPKEWYE